uniref:Placenta associated 9 n=1 Tax=Microcebus murinus TaxID=30608 RepID=A0A8B7G6K1_MICMU|nr:placenta-specific protein 9 isoform X2 [Microcebus murinus]XP_012617934.1 placenta-specific protein 9 isoform X2 [Microcebus murinus]XP_012617935.1 placenta-specific protein 9 isoform X2 [Microcebus murinus]
MLVHTAVFARALPPGRRLSSYPASPSSGSTSLRKPLESAAAEPFSPSRGGPAQSTGCDRHGAVQGRLDIMEETLEKTVEHLETEVKGLLGLLEELAWNLPPGPFSPAPDLLGDDSF